MTIPRSYFPVDVDQIQLHVFGDSSQEVFSAIAFLRGRPCVATSGNLFLSFVIGKARVAPMKSLTVPKLELQAALLATRLCSEIHQALTRPIDNTFLWSDSTTGLQWLQSNAKQPIFIVNRVCEFLELTTIDQWKLLRSGDWPFKPDNALLNDLKRGTGEESALSSTDNNPMGDFSSFKKLQLIVVYVLRILPKHSHFRQKDC